MLPVNKRGAEWRNDFSIGELVLISSEFYQPINVGGFFVAPRLLYQEDNVPLVDDDETVELRLRGPAANVDVGKEFGTWGELRLGLQTQELRADVIFGPEGSDQFDMTFASLSMATDTLDNSNFPTRGTFSRVSYRYGLDWLGGEVRDQLVEGMVNVSRTFRNRHTFNLGLQGATSLEDDEELLAPYTLGGFLRMSGLRRNELLGRTMVFGLISYFRQLGSGGLLGQPIYAGFSIEGGNTWLDPDDFSFRDLQANGSIYLGVDTFLGPVYAGIGFGEGGSTQFYLLFGQVFGRSMSAIFR